jgi:hypothetical protein
MNLQIHANIFANHVTQWTAPLVGDVATPQETNPTIILATPNAK